MGWLIVKGRKAGEKVYIEDIKARGPEGTIIMLPAISIKLTEKE
ncbi:MAG: hypothetical protein NTU44_11865 [Bacteroidetes bacterium]|nr:hypothetical protein [Bacteroidota bacterium]